VRAPFDRQARGPRVIAAMLPGDAHEGGLLMASVILAVRGWRLIYLGVDMPIEQITTAAREGEVQVVALSLSATFPERRAGKALAELRDTLPRRGALWAGGAGAAKPPKASSVSRAWRRWMRGSPRNRRDRGQQRPCTLLETAPRAGDAASGVPRRGSA
jgi:methylmalonyl-CoA mutase cobalamin-binding subunit